MALFYPIFSLRKIENPIYILGMAPDLGNEILICHMCIFII